MDDEDPLAQRAVELRQRVEAQRIWAEVLHRQHVAVVRDVHEVSRRIDAFLALLPPRR